MGLHACACACACVLTEHALLGLMQVLVHCDTGVSRSAAVCCAYIMAHTLVPYSEAIALVKVSGVPLSCYLALAPADVQHLCRASDGVWETRVGLRSRPLAASCSARYKALLWVQVSCLSTCGVCSRC